MYLKILCLFVWLRRYCWKSQQLSNNSKQPQHHKNNWLPGTSIYPVLCTFYSTKHKPDMKIWDVSVLPFWWQKAMISIKFFQYYCSVLKVRTAYKPSFRSIPDTCWRGQFSSPRPVESDVPGPGCLCFMSWFSSGLRTQRCGAAQDSLTSPPLSFHGRVTEAQGSPPCGSTEPAGLTHSGPRGWDS